MKILVTGVNGQLGHDVMNELIKRGHNCTGSGSASTYIGIDDHSAAVMAAYVRMDITDRTQVSEVLHSLHPDAVIHCAAWTDVDSAEKEENIPKVFAVNRIMFTWKFILLLYPVVCLVLFNLGIGLVLSALYVFFRDIQYLWTIFTQLLMYLSAIFYTIDQYSAKAQNLFLVNPVYLFIRYFRKIVIEATIPSLGFHLLMAMDVLIALGIGAWMYKKYNTRFLYYV